MFSIEIRLPDINLSGLEALDFRRQLGLPDGTEVRTQGNSSVRVDVSEQWARSEGQLFRSTAHITRTVRADKLLPADVEERPLVPGVVTRKFEGNGAEGQEIKAVFFRADLTPERVIQLWRSGERTKHQLYTGED